MQGGAEGGREAGREARRKAGRYGRGMVARRFVREAHV